MLLKSRILLNKISNLANFGGFFLENFANRLSYLTELAAAHPALRDSYLTKSQIAAQKFDIITDEAKVKGHLEGLKRTMKDIEQQLNDLKESKSRQFLKFSESIG